MKEKQLTPNPNIRLVINGGSNILDAATVPVEWHFSEELIAKNPQYIVICDHEYSIERLKDFVHETSGNRYYSKVTSLVKYLQLFRPGRHHLFVMVFYGDDAYKYMSSFTSKGKKTYNCNVSYTMLQNKFNNEFCMETTFVEFDVPEELFAKKPETKFGMMMWNYVNKWYSEKPSDECQYRKRKIMAFTLKPIAFLILWLLASVFGTLYTLIGCGFILFLGYRPISLHKNILAAIKMDGDEFQPDLRFHQDWDEWRIWKDKWTDGGPTLIPTLLVPWIFILTLCGLICVGYLFISYLIPNIVSIAVWAAAAAITFVFSWLFLKSYTSEESKEKRNQSAQLKKEKREEEKARIKKDVEDRIADFLKSHASLSSMPEKVEVKRVIPVVDTVTRFTLRFWNLKAKVCKPFAR